MDTGRPLIQLSSRRTSGYVFLDNNGRGTLTDRSIGDRRDVFWPAPIRGRVRRVRSPDDKCIPESLGRRVEESTGNASLFSRGEARNQRNATEDAVRTSALVFDR